MEQGEERRRTYRIPEPKTDPAGSLTMYFKVVLKGVEFDDRVWDRTHWARVKRAATQLMQICGDFKTAKQCVDELGQDFNRRELTWTLETVLKYAHEWKRKRGGRDVELKGRQRFFDELAKQRASRQGVENGSENQPELESVGDGEDFSYGPPEEE